MDKISAETAQEQIDQFVEYYGIAVADLPDALNKAITSSLAHMKRAIRSGELEFAGLPDSIAVTQNLKKPIGALASLTYKEVYAGAKIGIKDDSGDYGKMYTFLAALSGEGLEVIVKLSGRDLSLAESLGCVFLQV